MAINVFAVPVFFVVFRETLETVVIVSVLLAFLKQTLDGPSRDVLYKRLVRQVWLGTGLGILICLIIGAGLIGAFYSLGKDNWAITELYWEGSFAVFASVVISIVGAALLRVSKMQDKWRSKLALAMQPKAEGRGSKKGAFKHFCEKYAMFMLPFITVLREGLEAVVFVAGVSFSAPATAVPLPVVCGLAAGGLIGYGIYKGGATSKLQYFLIASTCLLYLVAAGLFSRGVWYFESQKWNNIVGGDAAEVGSGPGSYDITQSVWHVNYANPEADGGSGWGIFNALLGWQNSATYGSVISYNLYWIVVIAGFLAMRYKEVKGHWPLMKANVGSLMEKQRSKTPPRSMSSVEVNEEGILENKHTEIVEEQPLPIGPVS